MAELHDFVRLSVLRFIRDDMCGLRDFEWEFVGRLSLSEHIYRERVGRRSVDLVRS